MASSSGCAYPKQHARSPLGCSSLGSGTVSTLPPHTTSNKCGYGWMRTTATISGSSPVAVPEIDLIITDVDGTLLNHRQELTARVEAAVRAASKAGVPLVVATGKAIGPWTGAILPRLPTNTPQIFLQGLLIRDRHEGEIIYSRLLDEEVIRDCLLFADEHNVSLTAYCGERIVCQRRDEHTDRLIFYGEPTPEAMGPLARYVGELPIYKIILMKDESRISDIRPYAEKTFGSTARASLTTAIPGMLEILPPGASKGFGVEWTLQRLGVDPSRCMALGDGENDIEMLKLVGLGVAVGNACDAAKSAADEILQETNDQDAVAVAIEEFVLKPRGVMPSGLAETFVRS